MVAANPDQWPLLSELLFVVDVLDVLMVQVLVEQDESNYWLAEHLREKLE